MKDASPPPRSTCHVPLCVTMIHIMREAFSYLGGAPCSGMEWPNDLVIAWDRSPVVTFGSGLRDSERNHAYDNGACDLELVSSFLLQLMA